MINTQEEVRDVTIDPLLVTNREKPAHRAGGRVLYRRAKSGFLLTGIIEFIYEDGSMRVRSIGTGKHCLIAMDHRWGCYRVVPKKRVAQ